MRFWTLTRFELKKTLGGRFFPAALALLLAVDLALLCGLPDWIALQSRPDDGTVYGEALAPEEKNFLGFFWAARRVTAELRKSGAALAALTEEERAAFEAAMAARYGEEALTSFPVPNAEMLALPGYLGDELSDFEALLLYATLRQTNSERDTQLASVLAAAKALGREALRQRDGYALRRNLNILRLYSRPRGAITLPLRSWDGLLFENPAMLFVFLLLLPLCAGSFTRETEQQTRLLLHTARYGKGVTLAAKICAALLAAGGLTLLFQLVSLGVLCLRGGLLGGGQPVSALPELRLFPYPITVWQYALLTLGCQLFAAAVLAALLCTVSALCPSGVVSYALGALLLGGQPAAALRPAPVGVAGGPPGAGPTPAVF